MRSSDYREIFSSPLPTVRINTIFYPVRAADRAPRRCFTPGCSSLGEGHSRISFWLPSSLVSSEDDSSSSSSSSDEAMSTGGGGFREQLTNGSPEDSRLLLQLQVSTCDVEEDAAVAEGGAAVEARVGQLQALDLQLATTEPRVLVLHQGGVVLGPADGGGGVLARLLGGATQAQSFSCVE